MADTVWLDVLPSLTNFAKELSSGATSAADSAGKQSGDSWSKAFSATASDGGAQKIVDGLKKASVDAEKAVSQETQAIAKARASQSDAAAKVVEAEAKLAAARKGDDAAKVEAAELRLQGARERLDGATSKVEQTEKSLAAASRNRKEVSEQLADAEGKLADSTKEAGDQAEKSGSVFDRFKTFLFGAKDGSEQTEGALNKLGKAFSENSGKIALGVGGAALAAGKGLYEIGSTFDDVSDTIRVGTGATGGALDGLVEVATNVGKTVPAQFSEIGPVVADLNTRLGLSGDTLQTVASQYLEAGRILGQDVDINQTTAAFSAFKIAGDDVIGGMDTLFQISQATGVSMNDLAAAVQDNAPAMQNLGFTFEETASLAGQLDKAGLESKTTLAAMGKGLVNLAKDGEEPQEAFRRVTGEIQDMIDAGDIAGAIDLSSGVFGTKAANQFVGAVQDGSLALDDLVANVQASDDTILGVGEETSDFAESWQLVKNNALAALEPLGSTVFNALGDALSEAVPYVTAFGDWVTEHPNLVTGLAIGVGVLAAALGVAAAAQWAMNFAMFASPITWILAGVVLVIGVFVALWTQVDGFRNFFLGAWDAIKTAAGAVADWFTGTLVPAFQGAWEGIKSAASAVADWFTGTLVPAFQAIWDGISAALSWLWHSVFEPIWDGIKTAVAIAVTAVIVVFEIWKTVLETVLAPIFDWLWHSVIEPVWNGIQAAITAVVDWFQNTAYPIFQTVVTAISDAFAWVRDRINDAFQWIQNNIIQPVIDWLVGVVVSNFTAFRDSVVIIFDALRDGIGAAWDWIKNNIVQPVVDWFQNTIVPAFTGFKDSVVQAFEAMRDGIETAWNAIKAIAAKPVEFVVNSVIAPLVETYNKVAGVFGVSAVDVPHFAAEYAEGGYTGPGGKKQPAGIVHAGEIVWSQENIAAHGGVAAVERLRLGRGYENGGLVMPVNAPVTSGYGYRINPITGASELHDGIDYGAAAGTPVQNAAAGIVTFAGLNDGYGNFVQVNSGTFSLFYAHLASIATQVGAQLAAGALVGLVGSTGMSTGPHLHLGAKNASGGSVDPSTILGGAIPGGGGSGFDFMGIISEIQGLLGVMGDLGDSPWVQMVKGAGTSLINSAVDWVKSKIGGLLSVFSGSSGVVDGSVQDVAQQLAAQRGWTGEQWAALDWIVQHESSWNPTAQNPTSTAYGLFQFLDSTWATVGASKTSDPSAQIQAGLAYIAQRYGNPLNAQAFWQANGWYDNGGLLDPGMTVAINGTGKTEKVLTDEQWATMARLAASATTSQIDEDELARLIAEAVKSALAGSQPTTETIQVVMDSKVVAEAVRKHNRSTGK